MPAEVCGREKLWGLVIPLVLHILLFLSPTGADNLKFEDIDRWLDGELALEARATLAENTEFVASIPLPRGKEAHPFASGQVDAELFSDALLSPMVSLGTRRSGNAPGLRLGANWSLGPVALGAGYASKHKLDLDKIGKQEHFDFSIQVSGLEFLTSLELVGTEIDDSVQGKIPNSFMGLDRSFLSTKVGMNYSLANLALLRAGVEFVDLDALLQDETGYQTSAGLGIDAKIPGFPKTQLSAGYFFSGNTAQENFVWEKSRANAAVEVEVPGGGRIVVDCAIDGLGLENSNLSSSFGLGYYFQPQAFFKLGYTQAQTSEEKGQTAAELSIRF